MDRKRKVIKKFIHTIDPSIRIWTRNKGGFWCVISENHINIPVKDYDFEANLYANFLKEKFNVDYNVFVISILHEIGHLKTHNLQLEAETQLLYLALKENYSEDKIEEYNYSYFNLPAELKATKWAIEFYKSNFEFCENFVKKLKEL